MAEQQIFNLIPKIMADVAAIEKTHKNAQQGYAFRGIDDVLAAFHNPLAKYGVFYVPEVIDKEVTERVTANGKTLIYTALTIAYTFYGPDGSSVRAVVVGEAMDSGDKSSNKAMSAALKYALLQIFCVPTEEMEDADQESHEVVPGSKRQAQPAPPLKKAAKTEPKQGIVEIVADADTPQNRLMAQFRELGMTQAQVRAVLKSTINLERPANPVHQLLNNLLPNEAQQVLDTLQKELAG